MRDNGVFIAANDGTKIHVIEKGEGHPVLFLAGGGFSIKVFETSIKNFSKDFRVIAIDMRAHGKSQRVNYGLRLSRLAQDLKNVIEVMQLNRFTLIGHSLGCSVIYSFLDLFTGVQVEKLVLIDEAPVLTANPIWSQEKRELLGASYDPVQNYHFINQLRIADYEEMKQKLVDAMTTRSASDSTKTFIKSCFDIEPGAAALLYRENLQHDWRDLVPRIRIPSLIIGGKASLTPWKSQEWISKQIPNSTLKVFEEEEGGGHFPFVENPGLFNEVVFHFLTKHTQPAVY